MNDLQVIAYFGGLALLLFVAAAFFAVMLLRGRGGEQRGAPGRRPPRAKAAGGPLIQAVWPDEESGLVWLIEGEVFTDLGRPMTPAQRARLDAFALKLDLELDHLPDPVVRPVEVAGATATAEGPVPIEGAAPRDAPGSGDTPSAQGVVPSPPPPTGAPGVPTSPSPHRKLTYEESLEQPLFERIRSSFFGGTPRPSVSEQLDRVSLSATPRLEGLDEILQVELARIPDAPPASIRAGSNGLLEIVVEHRIFEHIDQVPSEPVREALRRAVKIWENRVG